MKSKMFALTMFAVLSLSVAACADNMADQKASAPAEASQAVNVGNKLCPVSGEKVGEMGEVITIEHNGKIYNLCCPMCKKDFMKDPDKYTKIAEDEVAKSAVENK